MHGDFDGTSAYELINALRNQSKENSTVFIDTNDINHIHAFGIDVFRNNFSMRVKNKVNLIFLGKYKHSFSTRN
jgi:anti-anti-sigma regulatory factor